MTGCLAAKWGVIQNGGQGQNSIPLPVLLTPIQTHSSTLPSSVSSQLATGVWHSSYLLKPNLQAMDSCHREAVLVSDMTVPPCLYTTPGGRARGQSVPSQTMLEVTLLLVHLNAFN